MHKHELYAKLLLSGELYTHLAKVDLLARKMVQDIVNQAIRKRTLPDEVNPAAGMGRRNERAEA
ncbi:TnpV protein [Tissierella sp. MSJ-40]|uniref:TnpV protein n=1 Tax=Tissierella simiarum TaxID=2841534 RepID=A0ABS6E8S4_9FIRM|nr:TnpV protein [Tissierella simiarum]